MTEKMVEATEPTRTCQGTLPRWHAKDIDGRGFYMENGIRNVHLTRAHCRACAYVEVLQQYGGDVDLRGLHRYGACYGFLQLVARYAREGEYDAATDRRDALSARATEGSETK